MSKFIIQGGKRLKGEIKVKGAKNAATPILSATLLTNEESTLANVPRIEDVEKMLEIMKSLGTKYKWLGPNKLSLRTKHLSLKNLDKEAVCTLRSSILLFGSLAANKKTFSLPAPGGCEIGTRPIDAHLDALAKLGIKIKNINGDYFFSRNNLKGANIVMKEFSVTATGNVMLASVLAKGQTIVDCAAAEPYLQDLAWFLKQMGAEISGIGTHQLKIKGVKKLKGVKDYPLIPDPIEVGTFIILGAVTKSSLLIRNIAPQFLKSEFIKFKEANINFHLKDLRPGPFNYYQLADVAVLPTVKLKAVPKVHNMPYPGFSADLLPVFTVLLTQAEGTSLVHDWMYEGRLKYVSELIKMGADAIVCDPHRVIVVGPTPLFGQEITSFDLRAGATLIIAALVAKGKSTISNVYQVDRGYENLDKRLRALNADIKRVED